MTTKLALVLSALALAAGAASAQTLGRGGSVATGGAGPDGQSQGASDQLERCDAPKGTLAVVEPQSQIGQNLQRYGLGSPTAVIRMLVQQSNCFQVVERGVGMGNMMQERALGASGELQRDQNIGKGQMVAADFIVTPAVVFSENNAGGVGGALGGLLGGGRGQALGAIAGGLKFKQAETSMLLVDSRSGIQVASAQGSAQKTDFAVGGALLGNIAAAGGGYSNTPEGKVIVASFMDNWNNIVRNIRNNPSLVQARGGVASQQNAAASVRANAGAAGDVMVPKIAGVKVLRQPRDGGGDLQTLGRNDEVILAGDEQNGYTKVTTSRGDGWVKSILLRKP
ncbi:MAG: CsgG/HfaB family protein [Pseudomonadota bacterium]|nr:CsgG/HfaB family protein [Pseudomonadota bacterium]